MGYYSKNRVKGVIFYSLFIAFLSCKNEVVEKVENKELVMYQPSEMAVLMNEFYTYNEALKQAILNDTEFGQMPDKFVQIHTAQMTDKKGRTQIFNSLAPGFLAAQQRIIDTLSQDDLKIRYNATINMCISCHKTECVGPIPRIKKLLID
jgi:hypothetical protein